MDKKIEVVATPQGGLSKIDFRNVGAPLKNLAYIPAKTENGNSVNLVIDSGSSINLCDQQLAESLNCPILKSKNPVQVICSSGQRLTVDKYISFGLISENGITFGCQDFYIVKKSPNSDFGRITFPNAKERCNKFRDWVYNYEESRKIS